MNAFMGNPHVLAFATRDENRHSRWRLWHMFEYEYDPPSLKLRRARHDHDDDFERSKNA
jgi:hypothetical protein